MRAAPPAKVISKLSGTPLPMTRISTAALSPCPARAASKARRPNETGSAGWPQAAAPARTVKRPRAIERAIFGMACVLSIGSRMKSPGPGGRSAPDRDRPGPHRPALDQPGLDVGIVAGEGLDEGRGIGPEDQDRRVH